MSAPRTSLMVDAFGNAVRVSDVEFFRRVFGKEPPSAAEIAEREARQARIDLAELIHKAEYAQARREREAVIRDAMENGTGDYDEYKRRMNEPFERAAERVKRRMAELDRKRAA